MKKSLLLFSLAWLFINLHLAGQENKIPDGFTSLFNGRDFTFWKVPVGDNGHWKIVNGVIDYDAESEAEKDKNLWTEKKYKDFILYVDFRIKATPYKNPNVPLILPSGLHKRDENGKEITMVVPDSDSGILLRGNSKSQVNIWCWPTGCGEVYGYRMDEAMPAEVRRAVTPKTNADHNIGEWNTFRIKMVGDRVTVCLNGKLVVDNVIMENYWDSSKPIFPSGQIELQSNGNALCFRNIFVKEL